MFNGINTASEAVSRISASQNPTAFLSSLNEVRNWLKSMGFDSDCLIEMERRGFFVKNEYSESDTDEKMNEAKKRVVDYINELLREKMPDKILYQVLDKFDLFLEGLLERKPHKSAGITAEQLNAIEIKNEYDIQHFLYAYLKPLYPLMRAEVSEDAGYGSVRPDFVIDEDTVLEVKCTRPGLTEQALTEQVAADITNYGAQNIYFFIYDKEKVLKEPEVFKNIYEKKSKDKNVFVIIKQPKSL